MAECSRIPSRGAGRDFGVVNCPVSLYLCPDSHWYGVHEAECAPVSSRLPGGLLPWLVLLVARQLEGCHAVRTGKGSLGTDNRFGHQQHLACP
ncbi:hypothetical protein ES703_80080 [subsurface metagenome]